MLAHWDAFGDFPRIQSDLARWVNDATRKSGYVPAVDIFEDKEKVVLTAELPGIKRENVKVNVENGVLTISGHRKHESEEKKEGYRRVEHSYGSFRRAFVLPDTVEVDKTEAKLADGILTLTLPKKEAVKPREIEVDVR